MKNNGSLYLHAYFSRAGAGLDPVDADDDADTESDDSDGSSSSSSSSRSSTANVFSKTFPLIVYRQAPKNKTGVNLLASAAEQAEAASVQLECRK